MLSKLNYNIWERLEPAEEDLLQRSHSSGLSEILDEDPQRWITVNEEDAGLSEEHIVFRGFVNAKIGGKLQRIRTTGTPYLLLVSGKEGESEPIVTLINQTGSLCLSKDCKSLHTLHVLLTYCFHSFNCRRHINARR